MLTSAPPPWWAGRMGGTGTAAEWAGGAAMVWRRMRVANMRWARRIGRRGVVMLLIGSAWTVTGMSQLLDPVERFSQPGPGGALHYADAPGWGAVWLVCGVVAVVCGVFHDRGSRVSVTEVWGFNALLVPPVMWCGFYTWSAVLYLIPGWEDGSPRALPALLAWSAVVALLLTIADWREEGGTTW